MWPKLAAPLILQADIDFGVLLGLLLLVLLAALCDHRLNHILPLQLLGLDFLNHFLHFLLLANIMIELIFLLLFKILDLGYLLTSETSVNLVHLTANISGDA